MKTFILFLLLLTLVLSICFLSGCEGDPTADYTQHVKPSPTVVRAYNKDFNPQGTPVDY